MERMQRVIWLLALALSCVAPTAAASAAFGQELQAADKVRSVDRQQFATLLDALDARSADATPLQLQQLRYLRAYQTVVYRNDSHQGLRVARSLFDEATDPDLKFRAGSLLVNVHANNRNFTEGLRYLNQTLPMRHRVQDKDIRHDGIDSAALLYNALGQYKLGLQYADETLSDDPNPRARCAAGMFGLEAKLELGALPEDDSSLHQNIQACLGIGDKLAANFTRVVLARKWVAQGKPDRAIALLEKHLAEADAIGYNLLIARMRSLLAELKLAKGELTAAQRHAEATIVQIGSLPSSKFLAAAYNVLYQIAERQQQPVAALAFYRRYAEADRAHLTDVNARDLAYQLVREETLQKTQQLERLHGENQLLLLQQRVDQQANQNTRLMMLMLALLVALIGYWAYKVKRVQQSLRRFAETDALTGISNRHHFTLQAELALAQSAADGEACALIMFDLDHFKLINDSYGHDIGDWVLKQVARTCEGLCRRIDQLGRLGGEEFAILLRGIDLHSATRLAEDCRVRLTQIDSRESGHAFVVTASFGVSATPMSGYNLAKLLSHADQMLYSGKRAGRNRVHAYTGELFLHPPQLQVVPRGGDGDSKRGELPASQDPADQLRS